uniref:Uncharacterized protein n=1 Tax=Cacopsylla melanoneura TaxID=428564 RepID=A0A8D8TC48_9HEMI
MPQSREERLRKKREAEKRRYEKLKNDEEGRKRLKEKEVLQYEQKKKKGVCVPIKKLSAREQRAKRKEWRTKKKDYRQKKKVERERQEAVVTPPSSEDEEPPQETEKQKREKARYRNKKSREQKKKDKLIEKLTTKMEKYKKKYQRERNKNKNKNSDKSTPNTSTPATPRTRVKILLQKENNTSEMVQKVLFAECVADQLEASYSEIDSQEEKRKFKQQVCGKLIRKYKLQSQYKRKLRGKHEKGENVGGENSYKRKSTNYNNNLKDKVVAFFLEEANSRMMPGKKDFVSKGKTKMQKRYLNHSMKKLHSEFLKNNPKTPLSYTLFCKLKPFYVKKMNAAARETCKCLKCTNMELKAISLHRIGRLEKPTLESLLHTFGTESNETQNRLVVWEDPPFDEISNVKYYKWVNVKETIHNKTTGKEKQVTNIAKVPFVCSLEEFIKLLEIEIPVFVKHNNTKNHQYSAIRNLKNNLKSTECLIHMDFSENYMAKYSEEVQSFHFGGSRKQVSLHTVVAYVKDIGESVKNINFCTLSENTRHDVPAIWAHLHPVLTCLFNKYSTLDTIHFLSDSPSTQYRNKLMFYFLGNILKEKYPHIKAFTWNYSEAGHGKGAPDGIGGVCKRTADRIVGEGKDISTPQMLMNVLLENVKAVKFFYIEDTDIDTVSNQLDLTKVKAFPGTMQVHQVCSVNSTLTHLVFRTLSHFGVHLPPNCREIGSLKYGLTEMQQKPLKKRAYYCTIYSDSDEDGNVKDVMNDSGEVNGAESGGREEEDRAESSGREEEDGVDSGGFEEEYESDDEVLTTLYEAFKMKK